MSKVTTTLPKPLNGKIKPLNGSISKNRESQALPEGMQTPMREDAFELSDTEKKAQIAFYFERIMETLGLDLDDDSLRDTPARVAKMFVEESFSGLDPRNKPSISLFDNKYQYGQMLVEKNIQFYSNCEHHFVPIFGKAHVAYVSSGQVIGLSKLNRIVQYYARRPQVQERMTCQIGAELQNILGTEDVAVILDAKHLCVASRGIRDDCSATVTSFYGGCFERPEKLAELQFYLKD
ncbi:GTP cyclohydrolase I FolE [Robiginitalea sp. SC105]|uniref:GTP cyclohydrolase I FolE n=1 Tax=Robiginitalea sp. SC105 TaxID=2762332 RepID=UPI00163A91A9|nr:GTP cyclohydrolase I FolE [Robiginitalea sp. SC105]MBC2839006.1 GTP cyclohydrolase I FolE [Robiginitalea sp. SC105]